MECRIVLPEKPRFVARCTHEFRSCVIPGYVANLSSQFVWFFKSSETLTIKTVSLFRQFSCMSMYFVLIFHECSTVSLEIVKCYCQCLRKLDMSECWYEDTKSSTGWYTNIGMIFCFEYWKMLRQLHIRFKNCKTNILTICYDCERNSRSWFCATDFYVSRIIRRLFENF